MSKKFIKVAGFLVFGILAFVYVGFLSVPFFVNGILNSHSEDIVKMIEDASGGYKVELSDMKVLTTPKLTAGFRLSSAKISLPNNHELLSAENFEIKMSLLPLLARQIELDKISVENAKVTLEVLKTGHFMVEEFIPQVQPDEENQASENVGLPFGFRLSNHLPNIYMKNYDIVFKDVPTGKTYYLDGDNFNITDFIINKKVKVAANGEFILNGAKQFAYDVKIKNYVMPNIELNDLVFPPQTEPQESATVANSQSSTAVAVEFNVIDVFKALYKTQLCANLVADIKTSGTFDDINYDGKLDLKGLTVAVDGKKLPGSSFLMELKGKKIKINSMFYTAFSTDETTTLTGDIKTGKNPNYNLQFVSNAGINNIINLVDSLAKSVGVKELDTLSGTGKLDANFNIVGDTKKIKSSGYFKIPSATLKYGLYNVFIDKINADVNFADNNVDIKTVSFSVLNQPLTLFGKISSDAVADLHLKADKLLIKALVAAAGQVALLNENSFNSGTISMDATVKGKLAAPIPALDLSVDNVNIKNEPTDTTVKLVNAKVNVTTDGKTYNGLIKGTSADIINPMARVKVPQAEISVGEKDVKIANTYLLLNNSRIDVSGKVSDYMTKNLAIDILAKGNLIAYDLKNMLPADFKPFVGGTKGSLPLNVHITGNDKAQNIDVALNADNNNYFTVLDIDLLRGKSTTIKSSMKLANDALKFSDTAIMTGATKVAALDGSVSSLSKSQKLALEISVPELVKMPIPTFSSKSLVSAKGKLTVGGTVLNPTLGGSASVPELKIPEMLFSMNDMNVTLSGALANGKGTLKKLTSGGIVAENLSADFTFNPKNNVFYLKNISGTAFGGNVGGNVSYNVMNGKIGVDFKGKGLNAITAIEGAAGIKNALSGTLGFTANVTTSGATDVDMIKNLKGKVTFEVTDGAFVSIGRIENLVSAKNVLSNIILRTAVASLSTIPVIKNSANFKYIKGDMTFNNGWANISSIKSSGESVAYYVNGKYNILNGTANLVILGRLGSDVVAALGPVGELSVNKLTSYIPKFGATTATIINTMTSNPNAEKISEIPELSGGNKVYKDFKVTFNGGVDSNSSIKSFKWLSNPDMSAIQAPSLKEQVKTSKDAIKNDIKTTVDSAKAVKVQTKQDIKTTVDSAKAAKEQTTQDIKNQVQNVKDSVDEIKNLFKSKGKSSN